MHTDLSPKNKNTTTLDSQSNNASPFSNRDRNAMLEDLKRMDHEIEREKMSFYSLKHSLDRKSS
jgi:hypothetical protein